LVTQTRKGQRTSRSSTASMIKLGVHATMIPSKKAWVSSMTYPLLSFLNVFVLCVINIKELRRR